MVDLLWTGSHVLENTKNGFLNASKKEERAKKNQGSKVEGKA